MTMSMEKLFKDLPRDLQWEILTEFVGSHSVRKGKIIQKIVFDYRHRMLLVHASLHYPMKSYSMMSTYNLTRMVTWAVSDNSLSLIAYCHDKVGSGEMGLYVSTQKKRNQIRD